MRVQTVELIKRFCSVFVYLFYLNKCYKRSDNNKVIEFQRLSSGGHKRVPEYDSLCEVVAVVHREVKVDVEVSRGDIVQWKPSHHLEQSIRPISWFSGTRECDSIVQILCSIIITMLWHADLSLLCEVFKAKMGVSRINVMVLSKAD